MLMSLMMTARLSKDSGKVKVMLTQEQIEERILAFIEEGGIATILGEGYTPHAEANDNFIVENEYIVCVQELARLFYISQLKD